MSIPSFELVLPCYNESKSLAKLIARARDAALARGLSSQDFCLVLVENGSRDESRAVMERLAQTDLGAWFRMVPVDVNQGYGFGLWSGLQTTRAPVVGYSHADEQCDPADALRAFEILEGLPEHRRRRTLVKGARFGRNWKDIFVTRTFELIAVFLLGLRTFEVNAQPKVFDRSLLTKVAHPPLTFAFDLYMLYVAQRAGFEFHRIPVEFPPRVHGVSNWASNFAARRRTIFGMIRYMWRLARTEGRA